MKQEDYRSCMATGLKGKKGLSREERQLLFCVQSRLCSEKSATAEEAKTVCLSTPPKEPKARKSRKRPEGCLPQDTGQLASCLVGAINIALLTRDNLETTLTEALQRCAGKKNTSLSREKFIKKCFKENSSNGSTQVDVKEAAKLRTFCIGQYIGI